MTKTINIGDWDGEHQQLQVEDNATLSSVLQQIGITLARTQRVVADSNVITIGMDDQLIDGETYHLASNHVSGIH